MPLDDTTGLVRTAQDVRNAVSVAMRAFGKKRFDGFESLEYTSSKYALECKVNSTVFAAVGDALEEAGVPGPHNTLGDVMTGLGVTNSEDAHMAAHDIGCYCHGDVTGERAADAIDRITS